MFRSEELAALFKQFDKDGSGSISLTEARAALRGSLRSAPTDLGMSDVDIEKLLRLHDTNADGMLQFHEFVHFWRDISDSRIKRI